MMKRCVGTRTFSSPASRPPSADSCALRRTGSMFARRTVMRPSGRKLTSPRTFTVPEPLVALALAVRSLLLRTAWSMGMTGCPTMVATALSSGMSV